MKRTDLERKQEMYHLLTQWDKSGMNQREFCVEQGINYSVFKYWNKKRKMEREIKCAPKREQPKPPSSKVTDTFIPITVSQKLKSFGFHITYPNGVQVSCPEEIELEQFKRLIQIY